MQKPRYALVAYLKNPAGGFVENLRRELHPDLPQLAAHLSILPPRPLQGTESSALQVLERICGAEEPFEVTLGEVETFIPVTPTVYIRVEGAAGHMTELHSKLNTEALAFNEQWPYIPHLTIVKMSTEALNRLLGLRFSLPAKAGPNTRAAVASSWKSSPLSARMPKIAGSIWRLCSWGVAWFRDNFS